MVHTASSNQAFHDRVLNLFGTDRQCKQEKAFLAEKAFRVSGKMKFRFKPSLSLSQRVKRLKKLVKFTAGAVHIQNFFASYGVKYFRVDSDVQRRFSGWI